MLSDELNHASIIDGCRLSRSELSVYRHGDLGHLEELLSTGAGQGGDGAPTVVVSDTVFSMDGDAAPVADLVDVCRRYGALLVLDEAHAILGPHLPPVDRDESRVGGRGPRWRCRGTVVRVGTLSKTLGSLGGFVAASRDVVDLLVNRARSYIFSTAPSPADAAAALAALGVLRSAEGAALMARLASLIDRLSEAGLVAPGIRARSSRLSSGPSRRPSGRRRPCWKRGCGCRRSARRPFRSARAGCGSRCRRRTRTRM